MVVLNRGVEHWKVNRSYLLLQVYILLTILGHEGYLVAHELPFLSSRICIRRGQLHLATEQLMAST